MYPHLLVGHAFGKFRGKRSDYDIIFAVKTPQDFPAVFHHGKISEETGSVYPATLVNKGISLQLAHDIAVSQYFAGLFFVKLKENRIYINKDTIHVHKNPFLHSLLIAANASAIDLTYYLKESKQ